MREDTTTFCIYASERWQNAPLSPLRRKNLLTKSEHVQGVFFFVIFIFHFDATCLMLLVKLESSKQELFKAFLLSKAYFWKLV